MTIKDVKTGDEIKVVIEPVSDKEFKVIKQDPQFKFNWSKHKGGEVYKLRLLEEERFLGLMCIHDHREEEINAIEIELLEVGQENVGSNKKFDKIAGCLIAYACRESIKRGHEGYFFLTSKTVLIEDYETKYHLYYTPPMGSKLVGTLAGDEKVARRLIKEYL